MERLPPFPHSHLTLSLFPAMTESFELAFFENLYNFCDKILMLNPKHFEFKPRRSTIGPQAEITDKLEPLSQTIRQFSFFLGFENAFYTIFGQSVQTNLELYDIGGNELLWLHFYFQNWCTCVDVVGIDSNLEEISCGILHGSILGPLLFIILTNNSSRCRSWWGGGGRPSMY